MRYFIFTTLIIYFTTYFTICNSLAQVAGVKDLLKDPAISTRCKVLIKERNKKIRVKQKLHGLVKRNQQLFKIAPENKKSARMKLEINSRQLQNQLRLTKYRIQSMEENIVRQGCPGLTL